MLWHHLLAGFAMPLSVCLSLLIGGLVGVWSTRAPIRGRVWLTLGVIVFVVLGYGIGVTTLTRYLERQYPVLPVEQVDNGGSPGTKTLSAAYIVVLAGGLTVDPALPVSSWLSRESLVRVVEAVLLYHRFPKFSGVKLVISGGYRSATISEAEVMGEIALGLGVPERDVLLETRSHDTESQALALKPILRDSRFVLVTSAVHMPRAMTMFEAHGMRPIPAPTGFLEKDDPDMPVVEWFPQAGRIVMAEQATHEVMGLIWFTLRHPVETLASRFYQDPESL